MRTLIITFILSPVVCSVCFSQRNLQVSLGGALSESLPIEQVHFSETDSLTIERPPTGFMGSVLVTSRLSNPKYGLRYGLDIRFSRLENELGYFRDFDDDVNLPNRHRVQFFHQILGISLPVDVYYRPVRSLYTFVGVYPTFQISMQRIFSLRGNLSNLLNRLAVEDEINIKYQIKSHLAPFVLSYRVGAGVRHKFLGLELSYEQLLTNALKREFEFNGTSRTTRLTYYSLVGRLVVHLRAFKKSGKKEG